MLSQAELDDYAAWRGNVAAMRRALIARGKADVPLLRTLQRAFARELSPAQRAGAAEGVEGWRRPPLSWCGTLGYGWSGSGAEGRRLSPCACRRAGALKS